ncbi:MAG: hypothetical protein ABR543_07275 [Gemmatimonadaceae bacterium]
MNILRRLTFGTAAIAGLAACEHGDPVSNAGGPEGAAQLFAAAPSSATLPAGTLAFGTVNFAGLDPTIRDAFNRRPPTGLVGQRGRYFRADANLFWRFPNDIFRNARAANLDPRYPVPTSATSRLDPAFPAFDLYQPAAPYPGDDYWEAFSEVSGLAAGKVHEVAFVQYRTVVKGELDHAELFLRGSVSQPDSLFLTPGTIVKINTDWSGAAPGGCAPFPSANTNPFIVSQDPTDATGFLIFDKCWTPNGILWDQTQINVQSKSMVGRNDDVAYSLPNYNYIEIWEGAYGTGKVVLRAQIAQDLDVNGAPLANAFAPFPAPNTRTIFGGQTAPAAVDQVASFPLSQATLLGLAGTIGTPVDNLTFTISNLQKLATGAYRTWFINPNTGIAVPAKGTYTRTVGTTVVENTPNVSAFTGGEGTIKFVTDPYLAQIAPKTTNDSLSFFLVSVETDANVAQPSLAQSLWFRIFKIPPASVGGSVFGNFNVLAAGDTAPPLRFTPQGSMAGGVIGDTALVLVDSAGITLRKSQFVGSVLEVRYTGLQRPPVGYRYEGVLVGKADTTVKVSAGGLLGPNAESLDNADTDPVSANLTRNMIFFGRLVFNVATGEPAGDTICDYGRFRLYLVPKNRTEKFLTLIFDSPLPARVTGAASCR